MGSLASSSWKVLLVPSVIVIICILFFLTQFRVMNTLLIGDESATTLGIDVTNVRKIYLAFSAAVTGILVAAVGVISFTGLVIPHIVRMIVGSDHRYVIPLSVIVGSIFMIWCDVVSKIILKNGELPIGIITSMVGEGLSLFG